MESERRHSWPWGRSGGNDLGARGRARRAPGRETVAIDARPAPARRAGWLARAVCLVAGVASFGAALDSGVHAQDDPAPSGCSVTPDKTADPAPPETMELGETARITLDLTAECEKEAAPIDVMLVIDQSASMAELGKLANAKAAAKAFLDAIDLDESRVGLVAFNHVAGIPSPLSSDREAIGERIDWLSPGGQTNISGAIDLARQHLEDVGSPERSHAMIVLTDGFNTVPADPVPVAADRAKALDITVATICAGGACDADLEPAASEPSLYFNVPDPTELVELYRTLASRLVENAIVSLTIVDVLPSNMRFVPGSAVPPVDSAVTDPTSRETTLTWTLRGGMPAGGLSYLVEPLEVGRHPTNVVATGEFVDRKGRSGETIFPIPEVEVVAPPCMPRALEIYILVDDSTCLLNTKLSGMSAIQAIAEGTDNLLDTLSMGRDTAAVIGFGDTAELFQELTTDQRAVYDGILRVAMRDSSARLDLAYEEVRRELRSPRHNPRAQVVTLAITDGPMMAAPDRSVARAEQLERESGALHYVIAVGPIVQHTILKAIAVEGGYRHIALGGDILEEFDYMATVIGPLAEDCLPVDPTPRPTEPAATPTPVRDPERLYLPSLLDAASG